MIAAYSRPIAMKIYKRILEIRPGWEDKVAVVMTASNKDLEEWHNIIGNKRHKRDSARAKMRMMIRKLLKNHRYPPEGMDDAVTTVMNQCKLWADNIMSV